MSKLSSAAVATWLGMKTADAQLEMVVVAAEAYVDSLPVVVAAGGTWSKQVEQGAIMLAARLHRRRNSPGGVEAMTEGGVSYIARYDADIARLLQIDGYQKPMVG